MKLLVLILDDVEKLETLLCALSEAKISGATIVESAGMARSLYHMEDGAFLGSLRLFLNPDREENRMIFMVLNDEQIQTVKAVIKDVIGDLSEPNTGILFTLPIDSVDGLHK